MHISCPLQLERSCSCWQAWPRASKWVARAGAAHSTATTTARCGDADDALAHVLPAPAECRLAVRSYVCLPVLAPSRCSPSPSSLYLQAGGPWEATRLRHTRPSPGHACSTSSWAVRASPARSTFPRARTYEAHSACRACRPGRLCLLPRKWRLAWRAREHEHAAARGTHVVVQHARFSGSVSD